MTPTAARFGTTNLARRLVLGAALALGLAAALLPRTPSVHAQQAAATKSAGAEAPSAQSPATAQPPAPAKPPAVSKSLTIRDDQGHGAKIEVTTQEADGETADKGAAADAAPGPDAAAKPAPGKRGKRAHVIIDGTDREFDSVDKFVRDEPAIAAMVFLIVSVVFLAPVLAIGLILWYRFRKARMLNETMLKLAEKGVVPPAEALGALASGKPAAAIQSTAAPIYEQARQVRRRAAWSDLRKGVMLGGVGLALSFYSMLADREPNGLGLVLLFVGLGFVVLWWFEERQLTPPGGTPPSGPGTPGNPPPAA